MSTVCYYVPERRELDLSTLSLADLSRYILPHYGRTTLESTPFRCSGNGASLYIQKRSGNFYLIHYGNTSCGISAHRVSAPMTDEHRRQQEYILRAAVRNGLSADLEVDSGNGTRLDVSITGSIKQGCEVQHSALSTPAAKSRTTKSVRGGYQVVTWFSDAESTPKWARFVPTLESVVRGSWHDMPAPGEASVKIGVYEPDSEMPWTARKRTLDETIALIDSGEVLPVRIPGVKRKRRASIEMVFRSSADRLADLHGEHAIKWHPMAIAESRPAIQSSTTCDAQHKSFYCLDCGKPLVRADSMLRQRCQGCYRRATASLAEVIAS